MIVKKEYKAKVILVYDDDGAPGEEIEDLVLLGTELHLNKIGRIDFERSPNMFIKDCVVKAVGFRVHIDG